MSARETILDAAARVMHEKGLAKATTKEIAREAGYSEALLYKHFADKQDIYLSVLGERFAAPTSTRDLAGESTVRENLVTLTLGLMAFYVKTFPMSASIFSERELLANWRESLAARGTGPRGPLLIIERYLEAEVRLGRVAALDCSAASALLCGAAFQHAFLACFEGLDEVPDARPLAERLVDTLGVS